MLESDATVWMVRWELRNCHLKILSHALSRLLVWNERRFEDICDLPANAE